MWMQHRHTWKTTSIALVLTQCIARVEPPWLHTWVGVPIGSYTTVRYWTYTLYCLLVPPQHTLLYNSIIILYNNSTTILYYNSIALQYNNSIIILYNNSIIIQYNNRHNHLCDELYRQPETWSNNVWKHNSLCPVKCGWSGTCHTHTVTGSLSAS